MAKWIPHRANGDQTPIVAQKFKHWVGTREHWFCVHRSLEVLRNAPKREKVLPKAVAAATI